MTSEPAAARPLIFVTPGFGAAAIGGVAASAERIVQHLSLVHPVRVVTPSDALSPFTCADRERSGVRVTEVGAGKADKRFLQFFADVIETSAGEEDDPLILGFYCNQLAYAATLAGLRLGRAPWLFARGNDIDLEPFGEWAFHVHFALSHAQRVFCVSRELLAKVRAFCPKAKAHWLPNGVDSKRFPLLEPRLPGERLTLGLFGEIKHKKGLDLLLAGLDFDRFELRIVGQLREDAARLLHGFLTLHPHLVERIATLPYQRDTVSLLEQYRAVDLVCLPSHHEGMANVMLEAMACGRPCVCSAVGGALDVVEDGISGFLFQPRSETALARAVDCAEALVRADAAGLGRRARAAVARGFSAKKEACRYLRALASAS